MKTATDLSIRRMDRHDLDFALDLAADEGWNPGLFDAGPFFAADPDGFLMAEFDDQRVGTISAVAYDDDFGFVGLYIVRPEFRGNRYGVALFEAGMEYLGSRTIGLDGVQAKQSSYSKLGFQFAYRTIRYEGNCFDLPWAAELPALTVDLKSFPLSDLSDYDSTLFPATRSTFLDAWIRQPGTTALGVLRRGALAGYGVVRPCRVGYKIGPLFAEDAALAEMLLQRLLAAIPNSVVYLDVPEPNMAAMGLAHRFGMKPVFETARMYRGKQPAINLNKVFGVTTLELG